MPWIQILVDTGKLFGIPRIAKGLQKTQKIPIKVRLESNFYRAVRFDNQPIFPLHSYRNV